MPPVDISVVIGFKDWGVPRLRLAVESLMTSFGSLRGEVIVSDYGSTECPEVREMVEALGGRHVYTPTDGVWSRSRALNAGFAASSGRVLVSTDADMVFSPRAMETIGRRIADDPSEALVLQCRNLPEGMGSEWIEERGLQWDTFADSATLRPRWGMGGMMATSREAFLDVRGFDERMQIYGGEDIDFAQRVRRSGRRVSWIEDPEVRMYHMWHPSSRSQAEETVEGRAAIEYNRDILLNDRSFVRNTVQWRHRPDDAPPAVSIVIATRNRASLLGESIHSALAQTVADLEVLVVDDGSEDDTRQVVEAIADPRLRYLRSPGRGVACARNFAADHSRGRFTVVHDDDDLMMPDRVERHLEALEAGDSGTYGGWVDFDDATGSVVAVNRGKPYSLSNLLFAPGVYAHATLMLETRLIQQVRYDERFMSGSDYNLAVRLARLGVRLRHTGHVHLVRRLHREQVTRVDSSTQQSAGRWSTAAVLGLMPVERQNALRAAARKEQPVDVGHDDAGAAELVTPYLPDSLVQRDLHVVLPVSAPSPLRDQLTDVVQVEDLLHPGRPGAICGVVPSATWEQVAAMSRVGRVRVVTFRRTRSSRSNNPTSTAPFDLVRLVAELRLESLAPTSSALVTGHSARLEAEAGSLLLGHWRAGGEEHYLLALPQGSQLLAALEASGRHRVEHLVSRRVSYGPSPDSGSVTSAAAETTATKSTQRAPTVVGASVEARKRVDSKGAEKRGKQPAVQKQRPTKGATGPSGGVKRSADEGGRRSAPRPAGRRVLPPARRTPALSRARLVGIALVLAVVTTFAAFGALAAGPWAALAAAGAGSTLAVGLLLAMLFARRAWHAADRIEHEVRGIQRRLTAALRAEGHRTRKAVAAAGSSTLAQVKESAATTQVMVTGATETLTTAQTTAVSAVETALASHAERSTAVVRGELVRVEELLEVARKESELIRKESEVIRKESEVTREESRAGVERLKSAVSAIPGATAKLMEPQDRRADQQQLRQLQSLLSLYSLVRLRAGAPNLGGWAASPDVMLMLANEVLALRPSTVLECGSGASTVWLGLVVRELGLTSRIVALEHDEVFAEATRRELERHGLGDVAEVRTAPLRAAESLPRHPTPWYDEDAVGDLQDIGLVFVDGPPGSTGPLARYPAVPLLRDQLADDCVVVLDDAARDDEREVADSWLGLLPDFRVEEPEAQKGVIVFRRRGS
jgi:glycosyltransferase involved in cell wall biosynthesis/predicted O-methyltransferase YrrM